MAVDCFSIDPAWLVEGVEELTTDPTVREPSGVIVECEL